MRTLLAHLIAEQAKKDPQFYVLSGDHGYALFDPLRKTRPQQFLNAGVSEQAMVGLAAGMAKSGLRPLVYGLSAFIPMRVLEFIKMDVCYESLPVVFLGDGAGLVYSTLGASHQCGEDIAVLQTLPNLRIYSPADAVELAYCFQRALDDHSQASYIRLGKSDKPAVHPAGSVLTPRGGCIEVAHTGQRCVVFATGSMVSTAVELSAEFPLSVVSVPCLSDFSSHSLKEFAGRYDNLVTMEEHSLVGGLASLIDRQLVAAGISKNVQHYGMQPKFTTLSSTYEVALSEHGLTVEQLRASLRAFL